MAGHHMFAVFDQDTARAPSGLELAYKQHRKKHNFFDDVMHEEQASRCRRSLERSYSGYREGQRRRVELGEGNGFSFEVGPYCHYCARNNVHALLSGEVASWPGIDAVASAHDAFVRGDPDLDPIMNNDAKWLLDFYDTFKEFASRDVTDTALRSLAQVTGRFAFVIFDPLVRRVWAARDQEGVQPLFWGTTPDGRFLFGSDVVDLDECEPTATAFPPGTLYASEGHMRAVSPGDKGWVINGDPWPGSLMSFVQSSRNNQWRDVKAVPRVTPDGMVCGAVYRVASENTIMAMANAAPLSLRI